VDDVLVPYFRAWNEQDPDERRRLPLGRRGGPSGRIGRSTPPPPLGQAVADGHRPKEAEMPAKPTPSRPPETIHKGQKWCPR